MSNAASNPPSNQDHDPRPLGSTTDDHLDSETNDLVQSVLADARELLDTLEDRTSPAEPEAAGTSPSSDTEAFDLTAVVPPAPLAPDEQVPDHGPDGPAVDLFARGPDSPDTAVPLANPSLGFRKDEPTTTGVDGDESSGNEIVDEAAMRLERLLADRLAEEYGSVADKADDMTADTTDGNEVGISSTRVIPASDPDPVGMSTMPEEDDTVEAVRMETMDGGVEETAPAGMVRVDEPDEASPDGEASDQGEATSVSVPEPIPADQDVEAPSDDRHDHGENESMDDAGFEPEMIMEDAPRSRLVAIATLPYRVLPPSTHAFVTPLALSLALWVPVAWTFAILGPNPAAGDADVLQPGFGGGAAAMERSSDPDDPAATSPVDPH